MRKRIPNRTKTNKKKGKKLGSSNLPNTWYASYGTSNAVTNPQDKVPKTTNSNNTTSQWRRRRIRNIIQTAMLTETIWKIESNINSKPKPWESWASSVDMAFKNRVWNKRLCVKRDSPFFFGRITWFRLRFTVSCVYATYCHILYVLLLL